MEKIGLLAGIGRLPVECAKAAKALGYEVYAIALLPETDRSFLTVRLIVHRSASRSWNAFWNI